MAESQILMTLGTQGSHGSNEARRSAANVVDPSALTTPSTSFDEVARELAELGERLLPSEDLGASCLQLLAVLVRASGASRASLMMSNPATGRLRLMAGVGIPASVIGQDLPPARRRISDWVFRERRSLILNGEVRDQRFEGTAKEIESALSVPVGNGAWPVGVLNLARGAPASMFGDQDRLAIERLATELSSTLERLSGLALAERGREALHAAAHAKSPRCPVGLITARRYQFAFAQVRSPLVAGDLCERVAHPDGGQSLMLADVPGHGASAIAWAALTQGLFVAFARTNKSPAELAMLLNSELCQRLEPARPVALWLAYVSPTGRLLSCSAGCPPPWWIAVEGGELRVLTTGGPPLGLMTDANYEQEFAQLLPGDAIVAASDGVVCATDPSGIVLGPDRFSELVAERRRLPLDRLAQGICEAALEFRGGPPADDLTVFALRFSRDD